MTQDINKGIVAGGLAYNPLNLVRKIQIGTSELLYYYDAGGQKHQMSYSNPSNANLNETTRYVGSAEWLGSYLKRIATGAPAVCF